MSDYKKKILLISVLLIILVTVIIIKKFTNEKTSNSVSFNDIIVQNEDISNSSEESEKIKVHITGEVNNPGLIELNVGDRIYDAIEMAGGLTENADTSKTNLAYILSDGEKIYIPNFYDEESENFSDVRIKF